MLSGIPGLSLTWLRRDLGQVTLLSLPAVDFGFCHGLALVTGAPAATVPPDGTALGPGHPPPKQLQGGC